MNAKSDFTDKVLNTYFKMKSEIRPDASEYDVRHRIIKYLVEELLGYQGQDYQAEKDKTDVKILDETHSLVQVVIETKKPTVNISEERWKDQAFGYSDAFTKFIVLTNGLQLKVWDKSKRDKPFIDLDFEAVLFHKRLILEKLTIEEKSHISNIWSLSKENLWSENKYRDFHIIEKIDITSPDGFQKLLQKLDFVMNQLLMGYFLMTFNGYLQESEKVQSEYDSLNKEAEKVRGNKELEAMFERERSELEESHSRFISFRRGYQQWLKLSGREDSEESKEIFCKETIYVLLNKILLIRICEDKGLVTKKISNNGITMWRQFAGQLKDSYKDLLDVAYKDTGQLYSHVYERGIFDWYTEGDGELNAVLNKVLYIFNHFDFAKVNRDILGKLYERYLPREQRKRLGEFYTPDEVVDYIIDEVGYTPDNTIEGKDLLDPACGSGGFLVKAMNNLIKRYEIKGLGAKEILNNAISHIYGFDINPFACHIAEMNLLFQVIELYAKAKEEDQNYMLPRFNIYQTDSLEIPTEELTKWQYQNSRVQKFLKEQEVINRIKMARFDFVVKNPPYVHQKGKKGKPKISYSLRDYLRTHYETIYDKDKPTKGGIKLNLFIPFIERSIKFLKEDAKLGFIVHKNFLKVESYKLLREYILNTCTIKQIVDLGAGIFEGVTGETCIIILEKEPNEGKRKNNLITVITQIKDKKDLVTRNFETTYIKQEFFGTTLDKMFTIYLNEKLVSLIKKIEKDAIKLVDTVDIISFGLNTIDNKKYVINKKLNEKYKRSIMGRDIDRYLIKKRDKYALYDKSVLDRVGDENAFLSPEKIVIQRIGAGLVATYDNEQFYCFNSLNMLTPKNKNYDLKYVLAILNSKLMNVYYRLVFATFSDLTVNVTQAYLEQIPIKVLSRSQQKKFIDLVDNILTLNKELIELSARQKNIDLSIKGLETTNLDDYPSVVFNISVNKYDQIRREGKKIYLNLVDFIECDDDLVGKYIELYIKLLGNKFKKAEHLKEEVCSIKIPKDRKNIQKVLIDYENLENEIREIPKKIKNLEKEIDQSVYNLYNLTEEEIKIVEEKFQTKKRA